MSSPVRAAALAQYSRIASYYDWQIVFRGVRKKGVAALDLHPGETVLEAGCGTGVNFARLLRGVTASGRVIGIDQSPEMLRQARRKITARGWTNVTLVESPLEEAGIRITADALFFSFTHDIFQIPSAVNSALDKVKVGGRVVAVCTRWNRKTAPPLANAVLRLVAGRYMTTFEGLDEPWRLITERLADVTYQRCWFGIMYVVRGTRAR